MGADARHPLHVTRLASEPTTCSVCLASLVMRGRLFPTSHPVELVCPHGHERWELTLTEGWRSIASAPNETRTPAPKP